MIDKINVILSEWDPIDIGYPLSLAEYKRYAQGIKSISNDRESLKKYLIEILEQMGLNYNPKDSRQVEDVDNIIQKLTELNDE